jgi:PQQ enzyme repeat
LNARTGERIWHFQTTHHDIWDRDLPAPPNLITVKKDGKAIDAVAQVTKQGFIFVFDRVTGQPIFPIKEIKAQKSNLAGEVAWTTQPLRRTYTILNIINFAVCFLLHWSPQSFDFRLVHPSTGIRNGVTHRFFFLRIILFRFSMEPASVPKP